MKTFNRKKKTKQRVEKRSHLLYNRKKKAEDAMMRPIKKTLVMLIILMLFGLSGCFFSDPYRKMDDVYENMFSGADLNAVTTNLYFPDQVDGVDLTWSSANWDVITSEGKITRGNVDMTVVVDLTLEYQGVYAFEQYTITVLKKSVYSVSRAVSTASGSVITVEGVVIGVIGSDSIIHDGEAGIYLKGSGLGLAIGDQIQAVGTKDSESGLHVIRDIASLNVVAKDVNLPGGSAVSGFLEINQQSRLYSIADLTVISLPGAFPEETDLSIGLRDSAGHEMSLLIKGELDSAIFQGLLPTLQALEIGHEVRLDQAVSNYYGGGYRLLLVTAAGLTSTTFQAIDSFYPDIASMELLDDLLLDEEVYVGLPSTISANALIIPVDFKDYAFSAGDLNRLEKAFFGTEADTGWESVKSYYEESSYGKFAFSGTVLDVFHTHENASYYSNLYKNGYDAEYEIIHDALTFYDGQIDYSLYDQNNDTYIDALYFVYAAPVYYEDVLFSANNVDLWWAYVSQYFTDDYEYYDGVEANYYFWAGLDFMDEPLIAGYPHSTYVQINCATYIHETGHMLGLEDYYDYDDSVGPDGGLGGADMMDYTVGDHNPFSKILLGWTTPLVVSGKTTTLTLHPFVSSGETVLISPGWKDTYFDEYFLIDFYVPTGLNAAQAGYDGLFTQSGIRIYHINAVVDPNQGSPQNLDGYYSVFSFNNSDTARKLIKIIEADGDYTIENTGLAENEDLFRPGDIFGQTSFPTYRYYNGDLIGFKVEVVSMTATTAVINIIYD